MALSVPQEHVDELLKLAASEDVEATVIGTFFSVALGCGLFAAAFFSDKSGHDQSISDATRRPEEQP